MMAQEDEAMRARANHASVVESKRRVEACLAAALAGLQQIYTVCGDNAAESSDHRMTLQFVREVAGNAFEKATTTLPRAAAQSLAVREISAEMIESGCRGMYGSSWDGPAEKQPGEGMKNVWRRYSRDCLIAALSPDTPIQDCPA